MGTESFPGLIEVYRFEQGPTGPMLTQTTSMMFPLDQSVATPLVPGFLEHSFDPDVDSTEEIIFIQGLHSEWIQPSTLSNSNWLTSVDISSPKLVRALAPPTSNLLNGIPQISSKLGVREYQDLGRGLHGLLMSLSKCNLGPDQQLRLPMNLACVHPVDLLLRSKLWPRALIEPRP